MQPRLPTAGGFRLERRVSQKEIRIESVALDERGRLGAGPQRGAQLDPGMKPMRSAELPGEGVIEIAEPVEPGIRRPAETFEWFAEILSGITAAVV